MRAFLFFLIICVWRAQGYNQKRCITPSNEQGVCVSIMQCPSLKNRLRVIRENPGNKDYLTKSICHRGSPTGVMVCCPEAVENDLPTGNAHYTKINGKCGNGYNRTHHALIDGVHQASDGEYPWIVALGYGDPSDYYNTRYLCSGVLITPHHVLTAAHCVTGEKTKDLYKVRMGSVNLYNNIREQMARVLTNNMHVHPGYDPKTRSNDIAVFKVDWIELDPTKKIVPICLPSPHSYLKDYTMAIVTSWGLLPVDSDDDEEESGDATLTAHEVPIVSHQSCVSAYALIKAAKITDNVLCAGDFVEQSSCKGDSGSPLMIYKNDNFEVDGIVSYGYNCDRPGYPAVFTKVSKYVDWIRSKLY